MNPDSLPQEVLPFWERIRTPEFTQGCKNKEYCAGLAYRIYQTAGARFETARRHKKKNRTSQISIIVLSFYAILFSMIATFTKSQGAEQQREVLSLLSIFMSSFIVAFSIYEGAKRYDARSESFLRCAIALNYVRDEAVRLMFEDNVSWSRVDEVDAKYRRILSDYTDNHSHLDYHIFRLSIGKITGSRKRRTLFLYWFNILLLPMFAAISPVLIFGGYRLVSLISPNS